MPWEKVAELADLGEEDGARYHFKQKGRYLSLIRHGGKLYCLDAICYHAGGPLTLGDIEDIDGKPCLTCPWHMHKLTLDGGEKLYQSLEKNEAGKLEPGPWKSMGSMQRTFPVEKRTDGFYIEDDIGDKAMASDKYCRNQEAGERILVGAAANSGQEDHDVPDLPTRPGAVLQGQGTAPWAAGTARSGDVAQQLWRTGSGSGRSFSWGNGGNGGNGQLGSPHTLSGAVDEVGNADL